MAIGKYEMRGVTGLLLVVNLVLYLIIIGLASWCFNQVIDQLSSNHFGGNTATLFMLGYALLGGVIGVSSVIAGFIHNRSWSRDSLGIATSTALISFAVTAIAFGHVQKQVRTCFFTVAMAAPPGWPRLLSCST
ncbi:hypothetical protein RHGRI_023171 [Rhododendron griersonianum]|uniref:Uncharacterized protein n=1 Tax=Rhododendron griersonianum TaxID=479676 RepID=A0AAV6J803_9ERIC|nr:hypothetical protein RHGRI_023171 [Rhododendron griersonianum]